MPKIVTCRELEDLIPAYLDRDLPDRQVIAVQFHLKMCRRCGDYLAAYRTTIAITNRLYKGPDLPALEDVAEDLVHASLTARVA